MSIELHCGRCGKVIRAPDNAGGKRGRCPYCKESMYIPLPPAEDEEIKIAPIDEEDEKQAERLRREAIDFIASVQHEVGTVPETAAPAASDAQGTAGPLPAAQPGEVVDLGGEVEAFLLAMRDSKLDDADQAVTRLKQSGTRARDYVEGLTLDEIPLQVEGAPAPLVKGFLKALLARLS